jgi:hypothetical protein
MRRLGPKAHAETRPFRLRARTKPIHFELLREEIDA